MNKQSFLLGSLFLVISMFLMGTNFLVGNLVGHQISAWTLGFHRVFWGFAALAPFYGSILWKRKKDIYKHKKTLLIFSLFGGLMPTAILYMAVQNTTDLASTSLVYTVTPVLTLFFALTILKEKITRVQVIGIILSICGALFLVFPVGGSVQFNIGSIYLLSVTIAWAYYTTLIKKVPLPFQKAEVLFLILTLTWILILPGVLVERVLGMPQIYNWATISAIVYASLGCSVIAWILYLIGIQKVGAARGGFFLYLMPTFAVINTTIVKGSTFTKHDLLAMFLIVSGIVLINSIKKVPLQESKG